MEFGRQSNLGSLISAVLVGLLALAANHYAKLDPSQLNQFMARVESLAGSEEPEPFSAASLRKTLAHGDTQLMPLYERWKGGSLAADDARIRHLLTQLEQTWRELNEHPQVQAELTLPDRLALVRLLFTAAEMDPMRFTEPFTEANIQMAQVADASVAGKGAALDLYHRHDFRQPDLPRLLSDLRAFADSHENPALGGDVYLLIANELKSHGRHSSALRVLEEGLERYRGTIAAPRLINDQIQLRIFLGKPLKTVN